MPLSLGLAACAVFIGTGGDGCADDGHAEQVALDSMPSPNGVGLQILVAFPMLIEQRWLGRKREAEAIRARRDFVVVAACND